MKSLLKIQIIAICCIVMMLLSTQLNSLFSVYFWFIQSILLGILYSIEEYNIMVTNVKQSK